jgi:hypothetical protein
MHVIRNKIVSFRIESLQESLGIDSFRGVLRHEAPPTTKRVSNIPNEKK